MLDKREKEEKDLEKKLKLFLHYLRIHQYSERISNRGNHKVVKCSICSALHCTEEYASPLKVLSFIFLAIVGVMGLMASCGALKASNYIGFIPLSFSLVALWYVIKRFLEREWME